MPMQDWLCAACNLTEEDKFVRRWDDPIPPCPACGGERILLFSRFAVPFSGSVHKYMDQKREGANLDGFWAVRRKSAINGVHDHVFLDTMQKVREFNLAEGLAPPGEVPTNSTISADGKRILSDGMPGQWRGGYTQDLLPARLWEMDKSLTSLHGKDPGYQTSGPPVSGGAADAATMEQFTAAE
jgi:predicted nucleic acid-binding Zn ribbon protein